MVGNDLDLKLKEAEAAAEKAHGNVAIVERKLAEAQAVVNGAAKLREVHAFGAATGDPKATAAMAKIKKGVAEAEQDLADLQAALPEALRRAAAADQAVLQVKVEIGRTEMNAAIRRRVGDAKEIDRLSGELDAAIRRYFDCGSDLESSYLEVMAARGYAHSMTNIDAVRGVQRVIDAMPQITRLLFPSELRLPKQQKPLAPAEAGFWNVPLDEDDKDGAAAA